MTVQQRAVKAEDPHRLDIYCATEGDAWRIYLWPTHLPELLARCFDEHGEAYPVYLDLEELDRQMRLSGVTYNKFESNDGSVEIEAIGPAATVLSGWLSRLFQSGTDAVFWLTIAPYAAVS
jgi:hypothetical protein